MGKKYFIPGGNDFQEVVDQEGEPIKNITAIQVYRDSIIVATKGKNVYEQARIVSRVQCS